LRDRSPGGRPGKLTSFSWDHFVAFKPGKTRSAAVFRIHRETSERIGLEPEPNSTDRIRRRTTR